MGLRRSEPSLEMRRDFPGSRWILRFLVNGESPFTGSPPSEETQKEEQVGGELAEVWAIHFRRAEFQVPAGDAEQAEHLGLELR